MDSVPRTSTVIRHQFSAGRNLESIDDGVEVEDWFPVFAKDVETNIPCCIDVGMIYLENGQQLSTN